MGDLESEIRNLSTYIESRIPVSITIKGKALVIDSGKEKPSARNVKALVKRFLHHKGLTESYKVSEEKEVVRITKRKQRNKRKTEKTGTKASSYDTLPFFFPNRPL
jgi:adenylate kinase family enzyme